MFRLWAAIACVAGALERKVWVRAYSADRFPGMYTVLVGPAGVGKSEVLRLVRLLWEELPDHKLGASSLTAAAMMDELQDAQRAIVMPERNPPVATFNSLKVLVSELGVLLPTYESEMMNTLTDIWDGYPYAQRRRTNKLKIAIDRPQINLLAGTTPSYFSGLLPNGAWDQGFLARTMLVYSGDAINRPMFDEFSPEGWKELIHDLKHISNMFGKMTFTEAAADRLTKWQMGGQAPMPEHPRLASYNIRRVAHLLKICMVSAASRNTFLIDDLHVIEAMDWLFRTEEEMENIFKAMNSGGDIKVMQETWYFARQIAAKSGKPVSERELVAYISERTPAHNVLRILETMAKAGWLRETVEPGMGKCYTPAGKKGE